MSHRDPVKIIPSITFQNSGVRTMFLKDPMKKFVGPDQLQMRDVALQAIRRFRKDHDDVFIDILHASTTTDSVGELRRVYAALSWEFTDDYAASIRAWRDNHPRVVPKIVPSDYGLDDEMIAQRLSYYLNDAILAFASAQRSSER